VGLTSGSLLVVMFGAAVAGILATILLWPFAAKRRIGPVVARIGMIVVSQMLVVAAFLVFLNGYFSFYTSWSQLLGNGRPAQTFGPAKAVSAGSPLLTITGAAPAPAPGAPVQTVPSLSAIAAGRHGIDLAELNRGRDKSLAQTGELLSVAINGVHTGIAVSGDYVYLPPQYFQPAYARTRFPAVLALTGYPGASWTLVQRLELPGEAALLASASKIGPAIYVMMNTSVAMPRDTECTNVPAGPQVETFFAVDVPLAIEHSFRVESGPGSWAVMGYSTGGFCAVKIAMLNPRQFTLAVSLAGYYKALQDSTTGNLYGTSPGYRDANSPIWRLENLPAPPISVLLTSSIVGERTYPETAQFLRLIRPPMRGYSLLLPQGGHNFRSWTRELPQSLIWLGQRLKPAVPQGGARKTVPANATTTAKVRRLRGCKRVQDLLGPGGCCISRSVRRPDLGIPVDVVEHFRDARAAKPLSVSPDLVVIT
jgi:enterochelin esterase-like enzyme